MDSVESQLFNFSMPQGLDEEQTLDLFKKYLMDEYRGSRSELQVTVPAYVLVEPSICYCVCYCVCNCRL